MSTLMEHNLDFFQLHKGNAVQKIPQSALIMAYYPAWFRTPPDAVP